jgi:TonB family protein
MRMKLLPVIAVLCWSAAVVSGQDDAVARLRASIDANPHNSFAHYQLGESFLGQTNYQSAANEFREALNGDLQPRWIEVWSHVKLGEIFEATSQCDRAMNEYKLAVQTNDNTRGALDQAAQAYFKATGREMTGFRLGSDVVFRLEPIQRTDPEYSGEARLAGLEGTVWLSVAVGKDGAPEDVRVTQSIGLGLDEKAIDAVRQWRFKPGPNADPGVRMLTDVAVDFRLPGKRSPWHLIGVEFKPPDGASRPVFLSAKYPAGSGVDPRAYEEARLVVVMGRFATAKLSFDVDEHGVPVDVHVSDASQEIWGKDAIALVKSWRFRPGLKDGVPISVPCELELIWGRAAMERDRLEKIRAGSPGTGPAVGCVGNKASLPIPLSSAAPTYTDEALKAGLQGTVMVTAVVGDDGVPKDIKLAGEPLGFGLDEKAIETVAKWRFRPAEVNGKPFATSVMLFVNFHPPESPVRP